MKNQGISPAQKVLLIISFILLPLALAMPVMQASRHYQLQREIGSSLRAIEAVFEEGRREAAEQEGRSRFARLYHNDESSEMTVSGNQTNNSEEEEHGQ